MLCKFRLFSVFIISSVLFISCGGAKQQKVDPLTLQDDSVITVKLGKKELDLVVASTPRAKAQGLSDRNAIPKDGMIFFFYEPEIQTFWMKNMHFPIDIVWIYKNEVIGIEASAPIPQEGVNDWDLPKYKSPSAADAVVELNAGDAKKFNITKGMILEIIK